MMRRKKNSGGINNVIDKIERCVIEFCVHNFVTSVIDLIRQSLQKFG